LPLNFHLTIFLKLLTLGYSISHPRKGNQAWIEICDLQVNKIKMNYLNVNVCIRHLEWNYFHCGEKERCLGINEEGIFTVVR